MSITAKEALAKLLEGNQKYVEDDECVSTTADIRARLTSGQKPYAIILSCADSRVIPESIFNSDAGEIFVIRVAGNVANTSTIASIEYAVAHIGCKLIMVLGHESCGAVTAALGGGDNGHNLNHLLCHITPAIHNGDSKEVNDVVKRNASLNAQNLIVRSAIIENATKNEGLDIVSGYYSLTTGKVEVL